MRRELLIASESHDKEERKVRELMPHKGLIRKVMSLSLFQLKRPQEDLEIANSVMK